MPLNQEEINHGLKNGYWRVKVLDETGSTQTDLAEQIRAGDAAHGTVLIAEFQSQGRGRLDRTFESPAGSSLLFSALLVPGDDALRNKSEWGWLPLLAAQSILAALDAIFGEESREKFQVKWPNDILLNEKKVAGILVERIDTQQGSGVIIGIGMNVHTPRSQIGFEHATSLEIQGFSPLDRSNILITLLESLAVHFERWEKGDAKLVAEYQSRSATLGSRVRIEQPAGVSLVDEARGVDATGALVLADGRRVTVGDVIHLHLA